MEIAWLEDFLAVVECGSFSRATASRHVTQSALSRRIRALEEWVGTPLFLRTTHSVALTPAGEVFRQTAGETLRRLAAGRAEAIEQADGSAEVLRFASTNALSLVFFPGWLRRLETTMRLHANIQLVGNHMEACERIMQQGQAQFLLCHHHAAAETALSPSQFRSLAIGSDTLIPVSVPAGTPVGVGGTPADRRPLFALPGRPEAPLPYLSFRKESGMGRIVAAAQKTLARPFWTKPAFSSHMAKLLVTMALEGRGMAWCPRSLIEDDLAAGRLVRAGDDGWDIPMEIHIVRSRARQSPAAERFWAKLEAIAADGGA